MGGSLIQRATRGCRAWGTLNSGSLIITTLGWSDCDREPYRRTFPNCWLACTAVLGKAREAGSHEDKQIEQYRQNQQDIFGAVIVRP